VVTRDPYNTEEYAVSKIKFHLHWPGYPLLRFGIGKNLGIVSTQPTFSSPKPTDRKKFYVPLQNISGEKLLLILIFTGRISCFPSLFRNFYTCSLPLLVSSQNVGRLSKSKFPVISPFLLYRNMIQF
jgi:hypothetical protein